MKSQKNNFDIYIYCEDDILFDNKNFNYWLKHKNTCIKNNYNLGFLRFEINKKDNRIKEEVSRIINNKCLIKK